MKLNQIKTIGDFMLYCKMPYWYQAKIKEMKVGDTFFMGQYRQFIENCEDEYVAEAWIEKHHGFFEFYGTWTFPSRSGFIMTYGKFKIHKSEINFIEGNYEEYEKSGVRMFALICRYLHSILKTFSHDEKMFYIKKGTSPLLMGVRVDKKFIGYKRLYNQETKKFYSLDCHRYAPMPQLQAIVSASIALGLINTEQDG